MATSTDQLIRQIKKFFEEETVRKNDPLKLFSDDVITLACQKVSDNFRSAIENEEDPMVIAEMLKNYLEIDEMVSERGLSRQQVLIKLFEQLNKYEQSRYS